MRKTLVLFVLLFAGLSFAQDAIDPDLAEQIEELERSTETLRGLEPVEDVPVNFPSREELEVYLQDSFSEFYTPELIAQEMAFYSAFGFIPADYDLLAGLTELYGQQIAGFYDTETKTMNVIMSDAAPTSFLSLFDQIIYVHEYTHALQDATFGLDAFLADVEGDAYLARLALVEGDASAVMSIYASTVAEANPLLTLLQLGAELPTLMNSTVPAGTPEIIEAELTFPYIAGQAFVTAVIEAGGWAQVDAAYAAYPPLSTENILHPEGYFGLDRPQIITLDVQLEGWELAKDGVFGEFYLREWLKLYDLEHDIVDLAATGWGGDRYQVFSNGTDSAFVLQIAFDTEQDQIEFLGAVETIGASMAAAQIGDTFSCWQGQAVLCIGFRGETGLRLISAPDFETALALLNG